MSDIIKPKRASLWREGLRLFCDNWWEWAKWAVWTFIIMAICQSVMTLAISESATADIMKGMAVTQKNKQDLTPEQHAAIKHTIIQSIEWAVPFIVVFLIQTYVFVVFFMKKQPGIGLPELSIGGFFYWVWRYIQLIILLIAVGAVTIGVPIGLKFANIVPIPGLMVFIVGVAGYIFLYYLMLRLIPVLTLAVCNVKPLFKISWAITKGNCWRLFGNILLFMLIIMGFYIVAAIVEFAAGAALLASLAITKSLTISTAANDPPMSIIAVQAILGAFNLTVFNGAIWAFYCAVARVFYEENGLSIRPSSW